MREAVHQKHRPPGGANREERGPMKKIIVLCVVLMLAMLPCQAAEWADGLSPEKPYSGMPEVDFSETIGYMMLEPVIESASDYGTIMLKIYMPREDVTVGEGTLQLYADDALALEIAIGEETMTARAMTEAELEDLIWGCGTVFEIEVTLEANRTYSVVLSAGCILAEDYGNASPEIEEGEWTFTTEAENYVENLTYVFEDEETEVLSAGDGAEFDLVFTNAAAAAVYVLSGELDAPISYFVAEDGEVQTASVTFPAAGEVVWGVIFLDEDGNAVDQAEYVTLIGA